MLGWPSAPHVLNSTLAVLGLHQSQKSPLPSRRLWVPMCSAVLLCSALIACSEGTTPGELVMKPYIGENVAEMVVQTLDGEPQPLRDPALAGDARPMVVNVWATWCTPCLEEMPSLDALGKSGRARVVAIATDASATVVKNFLRNQTWGQGIEVWYDRNGMVTREVLGAKALPTSVVLDSSYTITYAVAGAKNWADWRPKSY